MRPPQGHHKVHKSEQLFICFSLSVIFIRSISMRQKDTHTKKRKIGKRREKEITFDKWIPTFFRFSREKFSSAKVK
jgi:hypothetical protein